MDGGLMNGVLRLMAVRLPVTASSESAWLARRRSQPLGGVEDVREEQPELTTAWSPLTADRR